jgi:hypothetical protein
MTARLSVEMIFSINNNMLRDKIINYFYLLKKNGLVGTSYLFIGENPSLVKDVVKLVNCKESDHFCGVCWDCKKIDGFNHPDFLLIEPEPLTIKIEKIREVQQFLALKSFRLKKKTVFIKEGESFGLAAANAFLKTLEEPPKNSFIAICTSKLEGLLPTIISRCRKIYLPFCEADEDFSSVSSVRDFLKGINIKFKNRREFASFLWALVIFFRDRLVEQSGCINNRLLKNRECEIIWKPYTAEQIDKILGSIFKVYSAYNSVNENLALNLIRMNL